MTREAKRIAAVMAAVNAYLEQERAASFTAVVRMPSAAPSLWAVAGRLDQMSARTARATARRR